MLNTASGLAASRLVPGLLAVGFLALHLPFLPASLENFDSTSFALGIRSFDVTQHQANPPGYPIYILAAKGVSSLARWPLPGRWLEAGAPRGIVAFVPGPTGTVDRQYLSL